MASCTEYKAKLYFMDSKDTSTDVHEVTKFVEPVSIDREVKSFEKMPIPSSETATIEAFLGRPVLAYNATWETSQSTGYEIIPLGVGLPSDGMLSSNAMFADKLKGYNLVRADINYRIQMNCNPFQQGRILAHFLPFHVEMPDSYVSMHNFDITTKSQQPHVELDCRDPQCVLTIPYLAPTTHFELNSGHCPIYERGRLHLSVMSPLKTSPTGDLDVEVAIWVYFTNVELRAPIVPQSGKMVRKRPRRSRLAPEKDTMTETKAVSKGLSMGARVMSALSAIPVLADVAGPTSWALSIMSGVASSLGYSKPDVDSLPTPMIKQYDKYMATSDGVSSNVPLSALSTNEISLGNYSYCKDDEMSLAFLLSVPALVAEFSMNASDAYNTVLFSRLVSPQDMVRTSTISSGSNTQNAITGPPLTYLSSKFKFWRGSIKLRFSCVKTEMQSGRIQVSFTPLSSASPVTPTVTTGSYAIREIIDVTANEDTEMVIPYMLPVQYLKTGQALGSLDVRVVNTLRSPESASQEVDFLIFMSGGDDFEYAVPCNPTGLNVQPIVPQSGDDENLDASVDPTLKHSMCCIGERILSVRQLLRYTAIPMSDPFPGSSMTYWPWGVSAYTLSTSTSLPLSAKNVSADLFSFVGNMYALYRGGMDVMFYDDTKDASSYDYARCSTSFVDPTEASFTLAATNYIEVTGASTSGLGTTKRIAGTGINVLVSESNLMEAAVPYYNRFPVSLVMPDTDYSPKIPLDESQPRTRLLFSSGNPTNSPAFIARRPREDFQFSLFVGAPPIVLNPTIVT